MLITVISPPPGEPAGALVGGLHMSAGSIFKASLFAPGEYSQVYVQGPVNIAGAQLEVDAQFQPQIGTEFDILPATTMIKETFDQLPEGAHITTSNGTFAITYAAQDGFAVALICIEPGTSTGTSGSNSGSTSGGDGSGSTSGTSINSATAGSGSGRRCGIGSNVALLGALLLAFGASKRTGPCTRY